MTVTTIKVSVQTRDRLKAQAAAADITLGEYLLRLADAAERGLRFEAMREAIASTSPESLRAYLDEADEWADADLGVDG